MKIHCDWSGRLGNQLWELASTIGLAEKHGAKPCFPEWEYQQYFSVPNEYFNGEKGTPAHELATHIDERARSYLQDYNLFSHAEDTIRKYLQPSDSAKSYLERFVDYRELPKPVLAIHVRRGDNVPGNDPRTPDKHLYHPLRSTTYFMNARELLEGQYESVAVFSDDPTWAAYNIPADYIHMGIPRSTEWQPDYATEQVLDWIDLFLIAEADRHIISNSTFGWWGAFLSNNPAPIYPSRWFGAKLNYIDTTLMFPPGWVQVADPTQKG